MEPQKLKIYLASKGYDSDVLNKVLNEEEQTLEIIKISKDQKNKICQIY